MRIWESKGDSGRATPPRGGRRHEEERESAAEEGAQSGRRRATRAPDAGLSASIWEAKGDAGAAAAIWDANGEARRRATGRRTAARGGARDGELPMPSGPFARA